MGLLDLLIGDAMARKKALLIGCVGVMLVIGIGAGVWISAVRRYTDPMRTFNEIPVFQRASWMDEALVGDYARLMNDVSRKRNWSDADAAFVMRMLRMPRVNSEPPIPLDDVDFSFFHATPEQIAWFRQREGADEALRWYFSMFDRVMAWSTVAERMRLDLDIPQDIHAYVLESWVNNLSHEDPYVRIESVSSLMYTRTIEDPSIRVRIEAMRLSDPDIGVRDTIDRGLKQYDRMYHGIEPDGPLTDCNTCP